MHPDVLGDGPGPGSPGPPRRRWARRPAAVAAVVLLAGTAAVLAARSAPAPRRPPPAAVTAAPTGPPGNVGPYTLALAAGPRWAYALTGACRANRCGYRLLRRDSTGDEPVWVALQALPDAAGVDGRSARLVTAGDTVAVVEERSARAWVSTDGGMHLRTVRIEPGDPLPAVPPGRRAQEGNCAGCAGIVTVLDLATGRRQPLAVQPWPRLPIAALADDGATMWAVGDVDGRLRSAVSTDRGRSWRTSPLPGSRAVLPTLRLLAAGGGAAYLVAEGADPQRGAVEVWAVDAPGGSWHRLRTDTRRLQFFRAAASTGAGDLLLSADGALFRRPAGGEVAAVDVRTGVPGLDEIVVGGDGALFGRTTPPDDGKVWFSPDGGGTWAAEQLPR